VGRGTGRGLRGWASSAFGVLAALVIIGFGLYALATSAYQLWVQHSGVPAQVKIAHCNRTYGRAGWLPKTCSATWRQADGTQRAVTVHGPRLAYGMVVDVHARGDEAYLDGPWPWRYLLLGIAVAVVIPGLFWLRLRQLRTRRGPPR
jgi:hypothetical protein